MGEPDYLSPKTVDELKDLSQLRSEPLAVTSNAGTLTLEGSMPPQSVAAIHFSS
jgi:hypothetical protein